MEISTNLSPNTVDAIILILLLMIPVAVFITKILLTASIEKKIQYKFDKKMEDYKLKLQNDNTLNDRVHNADSKLYDKLLSIFEESNCISYFQEHYFANPYLLTALDPIVEFASKWDNPELQFHNEEINNKKYSLMSKSKALLEYLEINTWMYKDRSDYNTIPPEWKVDNPKRYHNTLGSIEEHVEEFLKAYNDLISYAKKELKL